MDRHQLRTLRALFSHPLAHGLSADEAQSLCQAIGAEVEPLSGQRLRIRMPGGQETWIHGGSGVQHPELDTEAVLRLRHLLQEAGISPEHPLPHAPSPAEDPVRRLLLVLEHGATRLLWWQGDEIQRSELRPHGSWGSGENLSHLHDRDLAGQRAPLDATYLRAITARIAEADAVLLLGHGKGESDLRQQLLHHLQSHRRDLLVRIVGQMTLDTGGLSDAEVLAVAQRHLGMEPPRRPVLAPGQERPPA